MIRATAELVLSSLQKKLQPLVYKQSFAGSYRRGCETLDDLDMVCVPIHEMVTHKQLFPTKVNKVREWIDQSHKRGILNIEKAGPRYIKFYYMGKPVDLFMTKPYDYGRMLAIRTGPAHFSKAMANRWHEMGWKGVNGKLYLMNELWETRLLKDKSTYEFTTPPPFQTEEDFFKWLGWNYIEPEKRESLYQEPVK